ncbi:HAD-IIIC family phosphatase [Streptomyces sp. SP17BM10]|uniref:HAD-IIIC family phosphatase n=1 Tax=Streptomyces sp. SP17BM10 TaxID=3002530 RepID=UPI002E78E0E6|nr:HAD-IIIC family phosphatase [Streptomyces sp. SP17BM10]MEE1784668.1 HAD-IIIC family phosphatase [Streptomyces sp. SP17BM10]
MENQSLLARLRRLTQPDAPDDPELLADLSEVTDPVQLASAGRLLANIPAERLGGALRPQRVALTGTFTADGVVPLLRAELIRSGVAPTIHTVGFDQLNVELSDPDSALAAFDADVTLCVLHDRAFLPLTWDPTDLSALSAAVDGRLRLFEQAVTGYAERARGLVLTHTVPLSADERGSVIAYKTRARLARLWRGLNDSLLALAEARDSIHVLDFEADLVDHQGPLRDARLDRYASMAWSFGVERRFADLAARFCRTAAGLSSKCVVLDLDNTLWGGVVGDDGPTGIKLGGGYPGNCYTDLQRRVSALRRQGVIVAVCSKNDAAVVEEVFARHPEMELGADEVVAWAVNWDPKDRNIAGLADRLNIGLASMVFLDDSSFECGLVRRGLPEVRVVQLGEEPAEHTAALLDGGFFDTLSVTRTDTERTELYRSRAQRESFSAQFESADAYLHELDLRVTVTPGDEFSMPRLNQLCLRTNQFTAMGTEADPDAVEPDARLVLGVDVADRFGREGIVGGLWIAKFADHWVIENFVLSCRAFSRGVEQATLQHVADLARDEGVGRLVALFRPTGRNRLAGEFYRSTGFVAAEEPAEGVRRYELSLEPAPDLRPAWITLNGEAELIDA